MPIFLRRFNLLISPSDGQIHQKFIYEKFSAKLTRHGS